MSAPLVKPRAGRALGSLVLAVCIAACHVPDSAGPRAAYISMASVDVGLGVAIPPLVYCALSGHRAPSRRCDAFALGASAAAAVVTAVALANQGSDREPDLSEWLVVATPAVLVTGFMIRELISKLAD